MTRASTLAPGDWGWTCHVALATPPHPTCMCVARIVTQVHGACARCVCAACAIVDEDGTVSSARMPSHKHTNTHANHNQGRRRAPQTHNVGTSVALRQRLRKPTGYTALAAASANVAKAAGSHTEVPSATASLHWGRVMVVQHTRRSGYCAGQGCWLHESHTPLFPLWWLQNRPALQFWQSTKQASPSCTVRTSTVREAINVSSTTVCTRTSGLQAEYSQSLRVAQVVAFAAHWPLSVTPSFRLQHMDEADARGLTTATTNASSNST